VLSAAALRGERLHGRPVTDAQPDAQPDDASAPTQRLSAVAPARSDATTQPRPVTPVRPAPPTRKLAPKQHLRPTVAERMQPKKRQLFSWRKPPAAAPETPPETTTVPMPEMDEEPVGYTLYQPTRKLNENGTPQ